MVVGGILPTVAMVPNPTKSLKQYTTLVRVLVNFFFTFLTILRPCIAQVVDINSQSVHTTCNVDDGLTGHALVVIVVLIVASVAILIFAVLYVQRLRRNKAQAQQREMETAVQDANVFLPR